MTTSVKTNADGGRCDRTIRREAQPAPESACTARSGDQESDKSAAGSPSHTPPQEWRAKFAAPAKVLPLSLFPLRWVNSLRARFYLRGKHQGALLDRSPNTTHRFANQVNRPGNHHDHFCSCEY